MQNVNSYAHTDHLQYRYKRGHENPRGIDRNRDSCMQRQVATTHRKQYETRGHPNSINNQKIMRRMSRSMLKQNV